MSTRFYFALALLLMHVAVVAHPVAQGTMEIVIHRDHVDLRAHVSNEEAFVAEAFGGKGDDSLEAVWKRHGGYLLAHLQLLVDGVLVGGHVEAMIPPKNSTPQELITYTLTYEFPAGQRNPGAVELRQNVLNEITFVPGNRWEAGYLVTMSQQNLPPHATSLFTPAQPLTFECDWNGNTPKQEPIARIPEVSENPRTVHGYRTLPVATFLLLAIAGMVVIWIRHKP